MPIDLLKESGSSGGGGWPLGETRRLPIPATKTIFQFDNMTLANRSEIRVVLASDYPDFYSMTDGFYPDTFFITRNLNPYMSGVINSMDSHGNTIVVASNGNAARSTDGGVTWASVSPGTANNILLVHYNAGLNKWYMYHDTNKVCISTDDGLTWVNTTVTGLNFTALMGGTDYMLLRAKSIGNTTVVTSYGKTFVTSNGTTYTTPTFPGSAYQGGKLTSGNGWFVLLTAEDKIYASSTGTGAWTLCLALSYTNTDGTPYSRCYGLIFDGVRWGMGLGGPYYPQINSSFPKTGPTPGPTDYYQPTVTANVGVYSTGVNAANPTTASWQYKSRTIGGYYITGWGYVGGDTYWNASQGYSYYWTHMAGPFGIFMTAPSSSPNFQTHELYPLSAFYSVMQSVTGNIPESQISTGGIYPPSFSGSEQFTVTADGLVARKMGLNKTFDLSTAGTAPARSLPVLTAYAAPTSEGPWCTRIK